MNENAASMNQNENHTMHTVERGAYGLFYVFFLIRTESSYSISVLSHPQRGGDMCMKAELQNIMESRKQQFFV